MRSSVAFALVRLRCRRAGSTVKCPATPGTLCWRFACGRSLATLLDLGVTISLLRRPPLAFRSSPARVLTGPVSIAFARRRHCFAIVSCKCLRSSSCACFARSRLSTSLARHSWALEIDMSHPQTGEHEPMGRNEMSPSWADSKKTINLGLTAA